MMRIYKVYPATEEIYSYDVVSPVGEEGDIDYGYNVDPHSCIVEFSNHHNGLHKINFFYASGVHTSIGDARTFLRDSLKARCVQMIIKLTTIEATIVQLDNEDDA